MAVTGVGRLHSLAVADNRLCGSERQERSDGSYGERVVCLLARTVSVEGLDVLPEALERVVARAACLWTRGGQVGAVGLARAGRVSAVDACCLGLACVGRGGRPFVVWQWEGVGVGWAEW